MSRRHEHDREAEARWGATDAYRESARRWEAYDEDERARAKAEGDELLREMAAVMGSGASPDDDSARAVAEKHRRYIDRTFYPCDAWMHSTLAQGYVDDPRFAATFDAVAPGLSSFFRDAVDANALAGDPPRPEPASALDTLRAAAGIGPAPSGATSGEPSGDASSDLVDVERKSETSEKRRDR